MEIQDQPQGLRYFIILLSENEKNLLKNVLGHYLEELQNYESDRKKEIEDIEMLLKKLGE